MSAQIQASIASRPVTAAAGNAASVGAASASPLLPSPSPNATPADGMALLYQLMQQNRSASMDAGKTRVAQHKRDKEIQLAQQHKALQDQEDAADKAKTWGILGKVASVVAIAVSAVATVFTCGAGTVLMVASCALSAMAFAEGETHAIGKLTGNEDNSKWITLGLGISSAICSGGAGLASSTATVGAKALEVGGESAKVASEIVGATDTGKEGSTAAMVLGIGGAAAGGAASIGNAVSSGGAAVKSGADTAKVLSSAARTGMTTAHVVNAGVTVAGGVATIVSSQYQAGSIEFAADGKQAQQRMAAIDRMLQWVIDGVKETDSSHKRATETLQGAMQTQGQTLVMASSMRV